jgi:outer membrane protein
VKNNLSIALNVVLLIAVGILFYLHFSSNREIADVKNNQKKSDTLPQLTFNVPKNLAGARVLYVNIDSIDQNYEAFADLSKGEGGKLEYLSKQYQTKALDVQQRYDMLQQKGQAGTISADDAQKEEDAINKEADEVRTLETQIQNLQNSAAEKNMTITNEVTAYFKEYSKTKGVDFILGYGGQSNVLYANDSLDITKDVLNALNENYRLNKPVAKPK